MRPTDIKKAEKEFLKRVYKIESNDRSGDNAYTAFRKSEKVDRQLAIRNRRTRFRYRNDGLGVVCPDTQKAGCVTQSRANIAK